MGKVPREVSGFVVLSFTLRSPIASTASAVHYLFLRPHDPKVADVDSPRSLFLVNIPVTTSELHLKHLFSSQLAAGRVERVHFSEDAPGRSSVATGKSSKSKKRKRVTTEEAEAGLDAYSLPQIYDTQLHVSGATAIVVFVDRPSMELTLKCARKAAKNGESIVWGAGIEDRLPELGLRRYERFNQLSYSSPSELIQTVDGYMNAFALVEDAHSKENARKRQVPDEDGFVTVTRGQKGGFRKEEADELIAKRKEQGKGYGNFYRFQMREKRKEQQEEMLRKFEEDKQKVEDMRRRRGG